MTNPVIYQRDTATGDFNNPSNFKPAEQVTVSAPLLEKLFALEFERGQKQGFAEGVASVRSFEIDEHLGTATRIMIIEENSRRALSRRVASLNPGHYGTGSDYDCTGRACAQYATLLRAYRSHCHSGQWIGVVQVSVAYDV